MSLKLEVIPAGALQTNAFLLSDDSRGEALLVDAPDGVLEAVEPKLKESGCELVALLLTHGHYDHIGDAAKIARSGVPLWGHKADKAFFENPMLQQAFVYPPDLRLEGFEIDHWVDDGDSFEVLGLPCEVRHVPGHCPGNILFYFAPAAAAFVGDALFAGSIGRTDLPGGDFPTLERSIRERIYTLPADTAVFPGHGPQTSVGEEMTYNPYVAAD